MERNLLQTNRLHLKNIIKDMGKDCMNDALKAFEIRYTYDAVSLEGKNKIPYEGVARLLKVGKLSNYSEREQKEVLNHVEAFQLVKSWVSRDIDLTEEHVKDLHELLVRNIFQGGMYRNVNIQITNATHQPPDHIKVYDRMKKLFRDEKLQALSDFDKALVFSAKIAKVHPFLDGNGRTSRLVMNFYLMKAGFIPISISIDERDTYFEKIEQYKVNKTIKPLEQYITSKLNERYGQIIKKLEK